MAPGELPSFRFLHFTANLAPSWRPKRLQNRGPTPKKSMLKNNTFSASILKGFDSRFGKVFGRFFEAKMHAKSETLNCVKHQQNTAWAHVFLMLALATSIKIRAKIDETLHVFWDIDFGWILGRFWEGCGEPKSLIFAFFSMFFRGIFQATFWKAQKSKKIAQQG